MPDIRYARNGGTSIAYHIVGDGPTDLVYVPDYVSNLVYAWESPLWRGFYERLARSFRLILFDKRGTGLSDGGREFATLETRMEDLHAVLDAAGSERAVVFGSHEGAAMATLYAATYPERTIALALFQPSTHGGHWEGPEEADEELLELRENWGTQEWCDELLRILAPTLAASAESREWFANWLRVGASPSVAYALNRAFFETDLSDVLPAVRVPTLVVYRSDLVEPDALKVADLIPSAQSVRVAGEDYLGIYLSLEIVDELEAFVAGDRPLVVPNTVLTTVLFTDIVGSTERAREVGDRSVARAPRAPPRSRPAGARTVSRSGAGHRGRRVLRDVRRAGPRDPMRPGDPEGRRRARSRAARRGALRRVRAARGQGGRDRGCAGARVAALARPGEVLVSQHGPATLSPARASSSRTAASTS